MAGDAVNHVGDSVWRSASNAAGSNPSAQCTAEPASRDDSAALIRPWTWCSGMGFRQRSPGLREKASPIAPAAARMLSWVKATSFGLDVVPDVCIRSAGASRTASSPNSPIVTKPSICGPAICRLASTSAHVTCVSPERSAKVVLPGRPTPSSTAVMARLSSAAESSADVKRGFSGQQVPIHEAARKPITPSGPRGGRKATRLPDTTPRARRPDAKVATISAT